MKKGASIDIPAEVKGLPLPTVQWMKDDIVIEKPDEEKMTMETEEVRIHSCVHLLHSFIMSMFLLSDCPVTAIMYVAEIINSSSSSDQSLLVKLLRHHPG